MDLSLFLAQVIGLYFIVIGASLLLNYKVLRKVMDDFITDTRFMFLGGSMILVLGLLLVASHNVWEGSWRVIITIIGWLTLFKGAAYLLLPKDMFKQWVKILNKKKCYKSGGVVVIILGLYLAAKGFGIL